jgi:hypothetical protein
MDDARPTQPVPDKTRQGQPIPDLPVLVVTQPEAHARRRHAAAILQAAGWRFEFVEGIRCRPSWLGCALSHERALRAAPAPPFVILEDDVEFARPMGELPTPPSDADLLYLGISRAGCVPQLGPFGFFGLALATGAGPGLARLWSMTSTHAILYASQAGIDLALGAIAQAKAALRPFDVFLSYGLSQRHCYALTAPLFQQSETLQGSRRVARVARRFTHGALPLAHDGELREGRFQKTLARCRCAIDADNRAAWVVESVVREAGRRG